ncbi:hypothetical protein I6A84_20630 [Frankia sp. CNm7]|uniref:Uncharacterized protein n=1 Tax=Frankia nepalensis TaxID=1836974 RepID=A0A937UPW5_9ACTN|nr:hypothetical protein [Frankia nepalensis]MBL7500310.1 hypothetical protein [Frankia nepalensis]MBL7508532.1 hypothetical protein [Frankia nepalensis]MBL7520427.1 hypothetical protein [Frankia nepalensis]MBL7627660.1 hypothetical protein [Frankia nepalensis]
MLVWRVIRQARDALHAAQGAGVCAGRGPLAAAQPPGGAWATCESTGCVDLCMDVWIRAHAAMHVRFPEVGDNFSNYAAYLTTVARSTLADLRRSGRKDRGAVAKPTRKDGTVGRIAAYFEDPWLTAVFRFLLGYVGTPGVSGGQWPVDALTDRKNAWDGAGRVVGSRRAQRELRRDIESCLAGVRAFAGAQWLYECLLGPLTTQTCCPLPEHDVPAVARDGWDDELDLTDGAHMILVGMLRELKAGLGLADALRAAVDAWLDGEPVPAAWASLRDDDLAVRRLAKRLLADLGPREVAA